MCGIAGIYQVSGPKPGRDGLEVLDRALKHRGPDDHGFHIKGKLGCLNRRLAIVDIAGGHQPILTDDGLMGIAYNGEVYNYGEVRQKVIAKGIGFHTNSDTEAVLKAFQAFGPSSFELLNGMFAFCLWDERESAVYLVRDPFGIKPLYYYWDGQRVVFASELKAILAVPGVDATIDPLGVEDYLTFRYVQAPRTLFKHIRKVEAGTYLRITDSGPVSWRYWDPHYEEVYPPPSPEAAEEEVTHLLEKAVRSQLMGEVPIGVLLSGGVDSSTIAHFVHQCHADLTTFNIGFPEVNEFAYSREVARRLELRHEEILLSVDELVENFHPTAVALDEPLADPACFPLYRLGAELKKSVTVVLSGEGGDELFGGYPQYQRLATQPPPYLDRFPAFMRGSYYFDDALAYLTDPHRGGDAYRHRKYFDMQPLLNGMLAYDMRTWMPDNLMMKADKILMAHSLEGRFPFLDKDLFEFMARMPQTFKVAPDGTTKWLLKRVARRYIPAAVVDRPKMGFTVPIDVILKRMQSTVQDTFANLGKTALGEVLNARPASNLVTGYFRGAHAEHLRVWTLFILAYWTQHVQAEAQQGTFVLPGRSRPPARAPGMGG